MSTICFLMPRRPGRLSPTPRPPSPRPPTAPSVRAAGTARAAPAWPRAIGARLHPGTMVMRNHAFQIPNSKFQITILAFLAAVFVARQPHAQRKPDVVLVTLDTVRADRMGFLGSTRGLTPVLDAF